MSKNRVGEKFVTNKGYILEIIEYINCNKCKIKFSDSIILENIKYSAIKSGLVSHPYHYSNREVGRIYMSNEGYRMEIIEYLGANKCTIQFNDFNKTILKDVRIDLIKSGKVKNPNKIFLCGIGFLGKGTYKTRGNRLNRRCHNTWVNMILRCYSEESPLKYPTYKDVTVCEEWHNFQNFAKWFEDNYIENFELDKDIVCKKCKTYSPETCCFVPQEINKLFTNHTNKNNLPIGVRKKDNKFLARFNKNYLGLYKTIEEAFQAYKQAKEQYIKEVADKWKDQIDSRVYEAMYNYQVEITD